MKLFFGQERDKPITVWADVRDRLPEDKKYHYRDGFSMAEATKCWIAAGEHLPQGAVTLPANGQLAAAGPEPVTKPLQLVTQLHEIVDLTGVDE
jgi:hypothetical protein